MAYTSDTRGKNLLTDIDIIIRNKLNENNIRCDLEFRVFDESNEDALLWEDGGLCFRDPLTNNNLGSNDAGWFLNSKPIFIVEATFGTERGQFGDGQLNRISHSLGPALNGVYGITMVPFKGESFVKDDIANEGLISNNISYKTASLHKSMALFALTVTKYQSGKYIIMDPYEPELIINLLYNVILNELSLPNNLEELTELSLKKISDYLGNYDYAGRSKQTLKKIYFTDGTVNEDLSRYYSHNIESLTTSTKRDGHGLLGKNLIEMFLAKEKSTSIFIRMDDKDFETLLKRKAKEFHFIYTNPRINVYNFDDLVFDDDELKQKVIDFRNQNLHTDTEKALMEKLQTAFNTGKIKIIKNRTK
ncbi:MAG: hypothetical protein IJR67_00065 [Acholeplasmatales bacterium]|nr:hypothetical protein [Acholeplasmatales bacterium]